MNQMKTKEMAAVSLMAAIFSIFAPISIPLGFTPVPVTLGIFLAVFAGILLGRKNGILCIFIYLLLGAAGVPVFSGYTGGLSILLGPTGGYLWGYLPLTWMTGLCTERCLRSVLLCLMSSMLGTILCYGMGTFWLCAQLKVSFQQGLFIGVSPFFLMDFIKILLAVWLGLLLKKRLVKENLIPTTKASKDV